MAVELELAATGIGIAKREKALESPFAPGRQELAGFESVALVDFLGFHRFLLKETGLKDASASSEETGRIEASAHKGLKSVTDALDSVES